MGIKNFLLKVYSWPISSPSKVNHYQKIVRDTEWEEVKEYIKPGRFLDVGSGTGYLMRKAKTELNVDVYGVDPVPYAYGVDEEGLRELEIRKGIAEDIPYESSSFDTVYSSHVLEHVEDKDKALEEIIRVLKDDGVIIVGMPTSTMIIIKIFYEYTILIPYKLINIFMGRFFNTSKTYWWEIFAPVSHSYPIGKTIFYDLFYYKEKNWDKILSKHLKVEKVLRPALYPYPDFRQLFKLRKIKNYSSSVFFVCTKKN